jgi:hypothetical protein
MLNSASATQTAEAISATQTAEAISAALTESKPPPITIAPSSDTPIPSVPVLTCDDEPEDPRFKQYWTEEFRDRLGCPELPTITIDNGGFVEQRFERGYMVWVEAEDFHFAFVNPKQNSDGRWYQMHRDKLVVSPEGGSSPSCGPTAEAKRTDENGPVRGFSALWCADELSVELYEEIGPAVGPEEDKKDKGNLLLKFEEGYMLRDSNGNDYILIRESGDRLVEEGYYIRK